jgi:hypothetical protein
MLKVVIGSALCLTANGEYGYGSSDYGSDYGNEYKSEEYSVGGSYGGYEEEYKPSYSSGSSGYSEPKYGSEQHAFVDAWFTFNKATDSTTPFPNSAARVSISKGKNDQIVLDHIFEDTADFIIANADATNIDCSTRDLGQYAADVPNPITLAQAVARCVHSYEIGIQLTSGTSYKKYGKDDKYSKSDPAIVSIREYGSLPVDIPAVKMNCVEINDAPNTQGNWAEIRSDSTVSLGGSAGYGYGNSGYGSSTPTTTVKFTDERLSTQSVIGTLPTLNPAIFAKSSDNNLLWNARGSPGETFAGTCAGVVVGAVPPASIVNGVIFANAPCAPPDAALPQVAPFNNGNGQCGDGAYCSAVESISGCFPGCTPGGINNGPVLVVATTTIDPSKVFTGFCAYPPEAKCVNKPRSLHCTATIELGTLELTYGGNSYGGYGGNSYNGY